MTLQENIFANALTIEELEAKLKATVENTLNFLSEGSCGVSTQISAT
ncbi:hypothetical protein QWZ08_05820 [Ferruginibacter paludis]|jgi:hypothetical protein|nr:MULTISPECIES: hypothetical protein [Ferruginibacter]MDB5280712.1 hypothetical protein [Ferruginibacter sp.]MDN3655130.1 hypothetical protein [Ferruginibacter paludis]